MGFKPLHLDDLNEELPRARLMYLEILDDRFTFLVSENESFLCRHLRRMNVGGSGLAIAGLYITYAFLDKRFESRSTTTELCRVKYSCCVSHSALFASSVFLADGYTQDVAVRGPNLSQQLAMSFPSNLCL